MMTHLAKNHGATTIMDRRNLDPVDHVMVTKADANAAVTASRSQDRNAGRGDANGDAVVTVGDVFYISNFLFGSDNAVIPASRPETPWQGDANCIDGTTVADVFFLINYLYAGGLAPSCPVFR